MDRKLEKALIFAAKHSNPKTFDVLFDGCTQAVTERISSKVRDDEMCIELLNEVRSSAEGRIAYFDDNVSFLNQVLRITDMTVAQYINQLRREAAVGEQAAPVERRHGARPDYPDADIEEIAYSGRSDSSNKKYNIAIIAIIIAALIIIGAIVGFLLIPEIQREKKSNAAANIPAVVCQIDAIAAPEVNG